MVDQDQDDRVTTPTRAGLHCCHWPLLLCAICLTTVANDHVIINKSPILPLPVSIPNHNPWPTSFAFNPWQVCVMTHIQRLVSSEDMVEKVQTDGQTLPIALHSRLMQLDSRDVVFRLWILASRLVKVKRSGSKVLMLVLKKSCWHLCYVGLQLQQVKCSLHCLVCVCAVITAVQC